MSQLMNVDRARKLMSDARIDVLIAHTTTNFSYLSGIFSHFVKTEGLTMGGEPYVNFAVFPLESSKQPFIVDNPNDYGEVITLKPWIKDVRWAGEKWFVEGLNLNIADDPVKSMVEGLKEKGLEASSIGLEIENMYQPMYDRLRKDLPKANLLDASPLFRRIRMIKTDEEIRRIKKAMTILEKCYEEAWSQTKEGMREIDFEAIFRIAALKLGGFVNNVHIGFGTESAIKLRPSENKLKKGDMITVDGAVKVEGYLADINKDAVLGKPGDELLRISRVVAESNKKMTENVKPGVRASDLYEVGSKVLRDAHLSPSLLSLGHGVGIQTHEPPFLGPWDDEPLAENMVITIEVNTKKLGLARWAAEDMLIVTANGYKSLSSLSNDLRMIKS